MFALQLFPSWFPTDESLIALVAIIVAILLMNRGVWWVINILAQDEPILVGAGVFIALVGWTGWLSIDQIPDVVWIIGGIALAVFSVFVWFDDDLDIRNVI